MDHLVGVGHLVEEAITEARVARLEEGLLRLEIILDRRVRLPKEDRLPREGHLVNQIDLSWKLPQDC